MAKLVCVLLVCLMALRSLHADNNNNNGLHKEHHQRQSGRRRHDDIRTNTTAGGLDPKTFNGKRPKSAVDDDCSPLPPNLLGGAGDRPLPPTPPWLDVGGGSPAVNYTAGVLSTRLIPGAYGLAMGLGVPANLYILVFLRARTKYLSTVVLYLSLALSDLLLLCSLGLRVHYHLNHNHWVFGETACRVATASFYWNVSCSAHTMACISASRYLAVVWPFLYRRLPKTGLALGSCLGVWLLSGASVVPELLVRQSYRVPRLGVTTCHDVLPLEDSVQHALLVPYRLVLVCVGLAVPFVVCVCSQGAVVYHLRRSGGDHWGPFVRVSSLIFLIFMLCFAPAGVLHVAHYARLVASAGHDDRLYEYYRGAVCLCCLHACLDPLLCLLMSQTTASKLTFTSLRRKSQQMRAAIV